MYTKEATLYFKRIIGKAIQRFTRYWSEQNTILSNGAFRKGILNTITSLCTMSPVVKLVTNTLSPGNNVGSIEVVGILKKSNC